MKSIVFACLISIAVGAALPDAIAKPWFCHQNDCPVFQNIGNFTGYELRRYEATKWAATNVTTTNYHGSDNTQMFWKLFGYISGSNANGQKIPMTAPVVKKIVPGASSSDPTTYIMHFMVPHNLQSSTPAPTDPSVYITSFPAMEVYVKSYPGYESMSLDLKTIAALRTELGTANNYVNNYFFTAGYDGPYNIFNRHNEYSCRSMLWSPLNMLCNSHAANCTQGMRASAKDLTTAAVLWTGLSTANYIQNYFVAGYDGLYIFNHHNEVWIQKS